MRPTFRGNFRNKLDAKGRVSIPADFRKTLLANDDARSDDNARLLVVYGKHVRGHLACYSARSAAEFEARIAILPDGNAIKNFYRRNFSGMSREYVVDDTGRLVLTAEMREKAGLEGEALFLGTNDTFEIWNPDAWTAATEDEDAAVLAMLEGGADPLSLLSAELAKLAPEG
ncbi:MraZ protein [Hasllibacter halocynthiae]|uniref:Transcriptional regulator MraZ n=1 Tax=Hasllibacter halocynthiae TaxID=595589 RepID=A0A2T0X797_9RHOB|nr:cell division/cell wall cluster transcriptional repressor MraZ [Hasllibacter halocynthiae]PRY94818.1 MraZ protein [Hasllibacter halocynthiae]